jgi:hypothetical protein
MCELFAVYQSTSTLFTGACRVPGSGFAGSREFKRVVKWRISPVFIAWRISDVKAEIRLPRRASAIPSRISAERLRQAGKTLALNQRSERGGGRRWHENCGSFSALTGRSRAARECYKMWDTGRSEGG